MATTSNSYTGNGSTTLYSITFPYLDTSDIKAQIDGVVTTAFSLANATQVQFNSAPANGAEIIIYRETSDASLAGGEFFAGSSIRADTLNDNFNQTLYIGQEVASRSISSLGGTMQGQFNLGKGVNLNFEGSTDDAHETTLTAQNPTADRTITLPNVSGTVVTTGDSGSVSNGMLADPELQELATMSSGTASALADLSQAEVQALDGVTSSTAELNILDGVTASTAEINKLDGVTATTAEINHVDGVTSNVQTQLNAKQPLDSDLTTLSSMQSGAATELASLTSTELDILDGATVTTAELNKLDGVTSTTDELNILDGVTSTTAELNILDGVTASTTEINYVDGVTSNVQTQLNAKQPLDADLTTLAGMQSGTASILASNTALTSTTTELNQLDGKTLGETSLTTNSDTAIPTSKAVADFVSATVAPLGGLEVISNELSFPNTQPAAGVVISISDAGGVVFNGSGVSTTGRTAGGSTVTINNAPSSLNGETLVAGVGLMVSSTGSSQTYNYHKILGKEDDIKQLSDDINDFNARYRVGSSNPTSALDSGDLFFNTSTGKLLVYNGTNSAWEEAQSVGNFFISTFSESFDGSRTAFTVSNAPTNAQQLIISINGVIQKPNAGQGVPNEGFTLSGSTVTFSSAIPSGSDYFVIVLGSTVNIGTPSNNTVTEAILQANVVSEEKLKVSNSPTNGYFLSAQSGNSGGLTWAQVDTGVTSDGSGNTVAGTNAGDSITSGSNNTAVGKDALTTNTTGNSSVAIGLEALKLNTTGSSNVGIGQEALQQNTTASNNTGVGHNALKLNTTGTENTALGRQSLRTNTTGGSNVAIGVNAMYNNSTGSSNTAVGNVAMSANTTGTQNVAVGANALDANTTASNNTAIGYNSLTVNTTGDYNTALGANALDANTTGGRNTAIGINTLTDCTTGQNNVAVGSNAGENITTSENNVAIGHDAMEENTTGNNNIAIGTRALEENTTASNNTAVGYEALTANTTGADNTAVGKFALDTNTTGNNNTAVGVQALTSATTAGNNTMVGMYAGLGATTGGSNSGVGYMALYSLTTGAENIAVGKQALQSVATASGNIAIGNDVLKNNTSSYNTAVGHEAMQDNTSGQYNVAVGLRALGDNTTANQNTAVGYDALRKTTTGGSNVAVGAWALDANTTANNNTAVGYDALTRNTEGERNVAIGTKTLDANTTASQNTAVGYEALKLNTTGYSHTAVGHGALDTSTTSYDCCAFGVDSLRSQTTGVNNSAFGKDTLANLTTGNHNTAIGKNAGNNVTTGGSNVFVGMNAGNGQVTTESDYLFIAREGVASGNDGCWIFGDAEGDVFQGNNDGHWATTSDQRLKKDIVDNTKGLEVIDQVKVKNFKFKQYKDGSPVTSDDTVDISAFTNDPKINQVLLRQGDTSTKIGVIAQELETVLPNSVKIGPHGQKTVIQDELFWHMLNAIKELSAKVTALEGK